METKKRPGQSTMIAAVLGHFHNALDKGGTIMKQIAFLLVVVVAPAGLPYLHPTQLGRQAEPPLRSTESPSLPATATGG
jgi:hypothetical protein